MDIKSRKGFTLTEVVITAAILVIIIVPLSLVFTTAYSSFINEADKLTAQQSAREVLYGKGINSYGIIGDLDRSNAISNQVLVGGETQDTDTIGSSITILDDSGRVQKKYTYVPDGQGGGKLICEPGEVDYFENGKSSNGAGIDINGFIVEKFKRKADTDSDIINITVRITCGKSGMITLKGSYRFPDIEKQMQ